MTTPEAIDRICGNCSMFFPLQPEFTGTDAETGKGVAAGRRDCTAKNIAWAHTPCVTGEFEPKETTEPSAKVVDLADYENPLG